MLNSKLTPAEVKRYKSAYIPGTRVVCIDMDDFWPVPSGTAGTVADVDDIGQVHVNWDNGRSLALVPGVDKWKTETRQGWIDNSEFIAQKTSLSAEIDSGLLSSKRFQSSRRTDIDEGER